MTSYNPLQLDLSGMCSFVSQADFVACGARAERCNTLLHDGTGAGNDFLGWLHLPSQTADTLLREIDEVAAVLRETCETIVIVGIGGSYLGARAVIEALSPVFGHRKPEILFAGYNLSEDYLYDLQQYLANKQFGIICISKSGTTMEPAIAFRLLRLQLQQQLGVVEARKRIVVITDPVHGTLRQLAIQEGYRAFDVARNIGGRYSVLSPVGLLPIAVAGFDIRALLSGARLMEQICSPTMNFENNIACRYATARYMLYKQGKKIEVLANFNPGLHYIGEWWIQLYGESEGKAGKGIFPVAADFTTDLHSLGQWIQQGERTLQETILSVEQPRNEVRIIADEFDLDGLNYLATRRMNDVNMQAERGMRLAHIAGGVPNMRLILPRIDAESVGALLYFFEKACGISGYMLGINPFDQLGVEAYKHKMFTLLGKPGYETDTECKN